VRRSTAPVRRERPGGHVAADRLGSRGADGGGGSIRARQCADLVAIAHESAHDMLSNESAAAGDEDLHLTPIVVK
jgi:hypothetical protein